jgi:hypothetical protein
MQVDDHAQHAGAGQSAASTIADLEQVFSPLPLDFIDYGQGMGNI